MLLSRILNDMNYNDEYRIIAEKPFRYLALTASNLKDEHAVFLDDVKYADSIKKNVSMVITTKGVAEGLKSTPYGICTASKPRELFFEIHNYLSDKEDYARDKFPTKIGEGCKISPLASISENNVTIGDNVIIEEFVVIRENTQIGDNTIIRAGVKIGGQGFEFKRTDYGIMGVAHAGGVIVGNNVEIQYNSCIDKAVYPWDNTVIGDNSKIDNLVHVGHAVKIAANVMVVANSGIGGRTVIKDGTWIGFGATITNGIEVGQNARANIGSVVTKSVPDGGSVSGNFAIEHQQFINNLKKYTE
jgi:acetyltransferase-like isoleucine patch superfamily enzyme